jgi:hypothetical protein
MTAWDSATLISGTTGRETQLLVSRRGVRRLEWCPKLIGKHSLYSASLASLPPKLYVPTSPSGAELARRLGVLFNGAVSGWTGNSVSFDQAGKKRVSLGEVQVDSLMERFVGGCCDSKRRG